MAHCVMSHRLNPCATQPQPAIQLIPALILGLPRSAPSFHVITSRNSIIDLSGVTLRSTPTVSLALCGDAIPARDTCLLCCTWDLSLFQHRVLLFWNTCIEKVGSHAAKCRVLDQASIRSAVAP